MRLTKNDIRLIFIASLIASCSGNNSYKIVGSVDNAADGDKVYMLRMSSDSIDTVDVAVIDNSSFEFEGKADYPAVRYLCYGNELENYEVEVFVEPGKTEVVMDIKGYAKGTVNNDLMFSLKAEQWRIMQQMSSLYNDIQSCSNQLVYEELVDSFNQKMKMLKSTAEKFAIENINKPAGVYVFSQLMRGQLPMERVEEIYSSICKDSIKGELMSDVDKMYERIVSASPTYTRSESDMQK